MPTKPAAATQSHTLKHPHWHGGVMHKAGATLDGLTADQADRIKRAEARIDAEAAKAAQVATEEAK